MFRYENGQVTVAGEPITPQALRDENYQRIGKHLSLTAEQARAKMAPEHRLQAMHAIDPFDPSLLKPGDKTLATMPDPFGALEATAALDVWARQRHILDNGGYITYWLDALCRHLDERMWLDSQLAITDPELAEHPMRAAAVQKRDHHQAEICELVELIVWSEAHADRCWQTLTVQEREPVCHMHLTDPTCERLIGRSWQDQARFFRTWPTGAYVDGRWFANLNNYLYVELAPLWQGERVWLGEPAEIPPEPDTWINTKQWMH